MENVWKKAKRESVQVQRKKMCSMWLGSTKPCIQLIRLTNGMGLER